MEDKNDDNVLALMVKEATRCLAELGGTEKELHPIPRRRLKSIDAAKTSRSAKPLENIP